MAWHGKTNGIIRDYFDRGMRASPREVVLPSGKRASISKHKNGYSIVNIGPKGRRRWFTVARLVCWQEHGPPPFEGAMCDHINGVVEDDRPCNLRWVTAKQNANNVTEKARIARIKNGKRVGPIRTIEQRRESNSPLSKDDVEAIKSMEGSGLPQWVVGNKFGVSQATISRIWRGITWY